MNVISILEEPVWLETAIAFFQRHWANEDNKLLYDDCLRHSAVPLPQWYLLLEGDEVIGGVGMIPNDFISRMDLYPWLCALYIEEAHRGRGYGRLLIDRVKQDAKAAGFANLYLATDHIGYYEKYGFEKIGTGHHPWGESSAIYGTKL